jgi:DNA primase small subunit
MEPALEFMRRKLAEYYSKNSVEAPPRIEQREFGAGNDKKIDFRHLAFRDENALNAYVRTSVPLYLSFSAGYYQFPDRRPMPKKNWLGADLIFDLDSDEYDTNCKHDGSLVCDVCMGRVRDECIKLIEEFLIPDFGFAKSDIVSVFSGNRGFHLHIRREDVRELSQGGRKELLDYLSARALDPGAVGLRLEGHLSGPRPTDGGWGGRIASRIVSLIESSDEAALARNAGLSFPAAKRILANKDEVLNGIRQGHWDKVNIKRDAWEKAVKHVAVNLAVLVDQGVTMDVSRLIRLPTSIHGGTGFKAAHLSVGELASFDSLKDPIALGTAVTRVSGLKDADVRIGDEVREFRAGKEMDLPEYAAYYGCAKGLCGVV